MLAPLKMFRLLVAVLVVIVSGLGIGAWIQQRALRAASADLVNDVRRWAMMFPPEEVRALGATREDLHAPSYLMLKDRLIRLRSAERGAKGLHLVRHFPAKGDVVVLVDSEPADSDEVSPPGDTHPVAQTSPHLQAVFRAADPADAGMSVEASGDWVRVYALVVDHSVAPGGGPRDLLGLELAATPLRRNAFAAGAGAALVAWLLGGLSLALTLALRRRTLLDRQVRKLAAALEQSHSAAMIVDFENRIEYVNASLCRQSGYSREELVGRDWRGLEAAGVSEAPFDEMLQCVYGGHSWVGYWTHGRKDGTTFPVRGLLSPVEDGRGRMVGFIAVFDDVTSLKQREAELRVAKERAHAGEQAKGQFLATMSHEVKTPLNGIVGFTSLLLETPLTPEQREYVQTIRASSEALIHLTTEILDFSRIDAGGLELELQPIDPRGLLDEALEIFASTAADKNLELLHRVAADVPQRIRTDPVRLRQILVNLVGNAVKFTTSGEVEATVRRAGEFLEFAVRDTGPGIAAADVDKIFRPFGQIDSSATRRFGGVGLGLAISRSLVRALGGEMTLDSAPGRGATFTFTLRCEEVEAPAVVGPALAQRRIALVVAHPGLQAELAWLLEEWGATPVICRPEELAAATWDLALVDGDAETLSVVNSLPSRDGSWRAERAFCLVPVNLPGEARRVLRPRFGAFLNKPLRHGTLYELLVGALTAGPAVPMLAAHTALALHVLVVEDNRVNQTLLQRILDTLGCEWGTVPNGRAAIEELALRPYDVVLMDLHMPELDGVSATRLIRAGEAGAAAREVWIAVVSADARAEQRDRAFAAGANDYLHKPVTLTDVEEALLRYLDERRHATR